MSSTVTLNVPEGFIYLVPAFMSTAILLLIQSFGIVRSLRIAAGIKYPRMYADEAEVKASKAALIFNCAQRAHQNTLEQLPILYISAFVTALKFPIFASSVLGAWSLTRFSYTRGYITGNPANRISIWYLIGSLFALGNILAAIYISGEILYTGLAGKFL